MSDQSRGHVRWKIAPRLGLKWARPSSFECPSGHSSNDDPELLKAYPPTALLVTESACHQPPARWSDRSASERCTGTRERGPAATASPVHPAPREESVLSAENRFTDKRFAALTPGKPVTVESRAGLGRRGTRRRSSCATTSLTSWSLRGSPWRKFVEHDGVRNGVRSGGGHAELVNPNADDPAIAGSPAAPHAALGRRVPPMESTPRRRGCAGRVVGRDHRAPRERADARASTARGSLRPEGGRRVKRSMVSRGRAARALPVNSGNVRARGCRPKLRARGGGAVPGKARGKFKRLDKWQQKASALTTT